MDPRRNTKQKKPVTFFFSIADNIGKVLETGQCPVDAVDFVKNNDTYVITLKVNKKHLEKVRMSFKNVVTE